MKSLASSVYEFLFQLTVFFIPNQLAFHFWPSWSHIFGIRVDYLAPTLYLTDIFVFCLVILRLYIRPIKIPNTKLNWLVIFGLSVFVFLNITQANSFYPAMLKWLKVGELIMFAWLVKSEKNLDIKKWIVFPLSLSVIVFSLIGIFQFLSGRTLGGILYYLGERSFNIATPGISKFYLLGSQYLRAYSTFPHPNALAGFLGVSFFPVYLLGSNKQKGEKIIQKGSLALGAVAFLLTASLGAFLAMSITSLVLLLGKYRKKFFEKTVFLFLLVVVFASVASPIVYSLYPGFLGFSQESFSGRVLLTQAAGVMIGQSPIVGIGLNNFIIALSGISSPSGPIWFLQPVHNLFLLVFSEAGLIGLLIFFFLLLKISKESLAKGRHSLVAAMLFILLTGFVDHYWLTLQQNELLLSLIFGLSLRNNE